MAAPALVTPYRLRREATAEPLVFDGIHPELCQDLEQVILKRMTTERRSAGSINVGGWKSSESLFEWTEPSVQEIRRAVIGVFEAKPTGWAMVNRKGSHHPRHQHSISIVSGVYYVTVGDPVVSTIFECSDGGELEVEPHPGRLVVFSGLMWHRVPKYEGETPRITIAFDVRR
jgi:hypothetical protein